MKKSDKIIARIQKLLALANDQQGTPEGDLSMSQAMKLMAEYGVAESDVAEDNIDKTVSKSRIFIGRKSYFKQRHTLVTFIADALNCHAIGIRTTGDKVDAVDVFGRGIDRERVVMLFSVAAPAMIASAMKAVPSGSYNIRLRRLSHMIGYAKAIHDSLSGHEDDVRKEHGDSTDIILADKINAEKAMLAEYKGIQKGTGSKIDNNSYKQGYEEGKKFDTGSKSRLGSHRALSA